MLNLLAHNVPRFIQHIKGRGGVSKEELQWLQCEEMRDFGGNYSSQNSLENPDYPMDLILRADEYLLYPKDDKTFMHGLFVLTLTLAIMSFMPGGVRFFGLHFCSQTKDFLTIEDG